MHRVLLSVLLSLVLVAAGSTVALALQSGGVEIGDLGDWISRRSTIFESFLLTLSSMQSWSVGKNHGIHPRRFLIFEAQGTGGRAGSPVLIKVTNNLDGEHGFDLSADSAFAAPTSMHIKITLKPGETKYIGIPLSDLNLCHGQ